MKIVFAGTPEYAVPSLRALTALAPRHTVVAVVTQPDRPRGRSGTPQPPPVKAAALELGFSSGQIVQPKSINNKASLEALRALEPDLLCVVAYGGLLRNAALALPKKYALNAHGSILPRHRGASPIQAALLAGDAETGVTIMEMVRALDAGPVMWERRVPIGPHTSASTLHDELAALSATGFVEAVELIERDEARFTPQDDALATYTSKLTKDSGAVDWSHEAEYLDRFVRAMTPWPGAWTSISTLDGAQTKRLRIDAACQTAQLALSGATGTGQVVDHHGESALAVRAGDGAALVLTRVQPEGKKLMSAAAFLNGAGRGYAQGCLLA